jgi:hypothetical protein
MAYLLNVDDAVIMATQQRRPLLFVFAGANSLNSRLFERGLKKERNRTRLEKFVRAYLFIDRVPKISDQAEAQRLATRNQDLQVTLLGDVTTPSVAVLSPDGQTVLGTYSGVESIEGDFAKFLDRGWSNWEAFHTGRIPEPE